MGKPPAVIIIARHGARLDAADKEWHVTSPTPYDPPLSYGGWNQARALGARIISLLHARENAQHDNSSSEGRNGSAGDDRTNRTDEQHKRGRKRKHKIIIHSSPYLRCLQTAVAVSAGISQHHQSHKPRPESLRSSSLTRTGEDTVGSDGNPEKEEIRESEKLTATTSTNHDGYRCLLRVDAFLGEWLTADYFDDITPPPSSDKLVAAAKAKLLQRGEAIAGTGSQPAPGHFPGGWGSSSTPVSPDTDEVGKFRTNNLNAMDGVVLGHHRSRAASCDTPLKNPVYVTRERGLHQQLSRLNTNLNSVANGGYSPPVPGYAISPSDTIPRGYVAHARDACVKIDYAWDSMREPQNWGDGAQYGEEWSAMHMRFRNGLQKMVDWYREHDKPWMRYRYPVRHYSRRLNRRSSHSDKDDDDDGGDNDYTDTALVIITHGAGCNALIGGLSSQPVLIDVGTASLTMAVRKDIIEGASGGSTDHSPAGHHKSPMDLPVAHEYDLKVVASSDHLRPDVDPSELPAPSSSPKLPPTRPLSSYRRRLGSMASLSHGQFVMVGSSSVGNTASRPSSASRASPGLWGSTSSSPRGSPGLWGSTSVTTTGGNGESSEDIIVPNFADLHPTRSVDSEGASSTSSSELWTKQVPQRTGSRRGLWGSSPLNEGRRRRWTVAERR